MRMLVWSWAWAAAPLAAQEWTPQGLPGLALWLDAADPATVTVDGQALSVWRDKSGRARDVKQDLPAARPKLAKTAPNGLPVVVFDGERSFLEGPAPLAAGRTDYCYLVVWRPRRLQGAQVVVEQNAPGRPGSGRGALLVVGQQYGFNGEGNDRHDLVTVEPGAWRLSCLNVATHQRPSITLVDNGISYTGDPPAAPALRLTAGAFTLGRKTGVENEYLAGEIAEVLVLDRPLVGEERRRALAWLDAKWGLGALGWFRGVDGNLLSFDFDAGTFDGWQVEGQAWGTAPARGTLPNQMPVTGFAGSGFLSSFHGGDGATGTLTSPPFIVERRYIRFLLGGGKDPEKLRFELLVDGRAVRSATGPNDQPGGSEKLEWQHWDVGDLRGKTARLRAVDQATGGWGHLSIDQITGTDTKPPTLADQSRELRAERRYLHLPVRNSAPKRRMQVLAGGTVVREFEIELAEREPDWWAFLDLAPFAGQTLTLQCARLPEDHQGLALVEQSDAVKGDVPLYREQRRPQFHFTTRRGWVNDPNGLVWHAGEYHLYYQHNPYGWGWGNMHWGHAVSRDLVHWEELPIAIYPRRFGDWVFSGSALVDRDNTGGFKAGAEDVLIAAYTSTGRGECIAYSRDRGRTFTDYEGNPVVRHGGRDPKLVWYAPGKHWVMAVYDEYQGKRWIAFLTSTDLRNWKLTSRSEGWYECPELFEIALDGDPAKARWVVYAASGEYAVGQFDGREFTAQTGKVRYNWGNCFYASQTYSDIPREDGRRIQIAWGQTALGGMPFNQQMNFPVELTLRTTDEGPRLCARPVREIEKLWARTHALANQPLKEGDNPLAAVSAELLDVAVELAPGDAKEVGLVLRGTPVTWTAATQTLSCRGKSAPVKLVDGKLKLRALVDRASLEVFAADGRVYMPLAVLPPDDNRAVELLAKGGGATVVSAVVRELRSAWPAAR